MRYEAAVSLVGGIARMNGPLKAGIYSELRIFCSRLLSHLIDYECGIVVARTKIRNVLQRSLCYRIY